MTSDNFGDFLTPFHLSHAQMTVSHTHIVSQNCSLPSPTLLTSFMNAPYTISWTSFIINTKLILVICRSKLRADFI